MEEGAWGMSTGLDYPPGSYADTARADRRCRARRPRLGGIYHTHVRYGLGDRFLDPFREAIEIGRRSGIAVHITHFYHRTTAPGGASQMLTLVEDARDDGLDVTFDSYPYVFSSTRLNILLPQWAHDGGPERLTDGAARSPEARARLRKEMGPRAASWRDMWLTNFQAARAPPVRGPVDRPGGGHDGQGPGRRRVRPAAGGRPSRSPTSRPAATLATLPKFVAPPAVDGRAATRC